MDILDLLRQQAARFQCASCGKSMADCQLELVSGDNAESLVKVTCGHCGDAHMVAVAVAGQITADPAPVLDEALTERPAITVDEVLDARLALERYAGDLKALLAK